MSEFHGERGYFNGAPVYSQEPSPQQQCNYTNYHGNQTMGYSSHGYQHQDIRLTLLVVQHQEHQHQQHEYQVQHHVVIELLKVIQEIRDRDRDSTRVRSRTRGRDRDRERYDNRRHRSKFGNVHLSQIHRKYLCHG